MYDKIFAQVISEMYNILNTSRYRTDKSKRSRMVDVWHRCFSESTDIKLQGVNNILTKTIADQLTPAEILEYAEWWIYKLQ